MTTTQRADQRRSTQTRRGFAMAVVLLLVMTISISIAAMMHRYGAQQRTVQRQIAEYHMHHDMFGVQAITLQRLSRMTASEVRQVADSGEVAFGFALPGGKQVAVYIEDGQSAALVSAEGVDDDTTRLFYQGMLNRLPDDRPDLLRVAGPPEISLNSAPEELIYALFGPDLERAAEDVIRQREREGTIDRNAVREALVDDGASVQAQQAFNTLLITNPSLWRLRIETTDGFEPRQFEMLVELTNTRPMMHAWRERFPSEDDAPTESDRSGRRRR